MYDWHKTHPEKSARFRMAMEGVTQCRLNSQHLYSTTLTDEILFEALDPGNTLFCRWFDSNGNEDRMLVVDVEGRNTAFLSDQFPALSFEPQVDRFKPPPIENPNGRRLVYLVRNILWNCSDDDGVKLLQAFIPDMEKSPNAVLLVNEMMSPARGTFERHVEKGYRRRDVTVMTMHNAKQRTEEEWKALFAQASPNFTVRANPPFTLQTMTCSLPTSAMCKRPPPLTAIEDCGRFIGVWLIRFLWAKAFAPGGLMEHGERLLMDDDHG